MAKYRPEPERFWEKVVKTDSCWLWTAGKSGGTGYGMFSRTGRTRCLAHRWAYEYAFGSIPRGAYIDHRCRNRACVNPDHLRAVAQWQNVQNHSGPTRRNKSGYRGVYFDERNNKWVAQYRDRSGRAESFHKRFENLEDAAAAIREHRLRVLTYNDVDREPAATHDG